RGIRDKRLLAAFETVPRHYFVSPQFLKDAYSDKPLPIGMHQTISQPYIVA
ncbi:MAG: protein-L-isoaspartate O-methyltransferase, partial [Calditrichaeota bacterium]|nr:protein-L-isoaspartate O-methyltransferase [Calditrichota bacterium]